MSKPIIVIRTVSVEKMSPVLEACHRNWNGHDIWVVSNLGRAEEMRRDLRVARVIENRPGDYSRPLKMDTVFEAVVVPVANEGGSGYGNVFGAVLGMSSSSYWLCSRCRQLIPVSRGWFRYRKWMEVSLGRVARFFGDYWSDRILEKE